MYCIIETNIYLSIYPSIHLSSFLYSPYSSLLCATHFLDLIKVSKRHVLPRQITMRPDHYRAQPAPLPPSPTSINAIRLPQLASALLCQSTTTSTTLSKHHHHYHHLQHHQHHHQHHQHHLGHRDRNKLRNTRHTLLAHREQIIPAWDQDAGVVGQRHRVRVVGGGEGGG